MPKVSIQDERTFDQLAGQNREMAEIAPLTKNTIQKEVFYPNIIIVKKKICPFGTITD